VNRLLWTLRHIDRDIGLPGVLGLALILCAMLFHWQVLNRAREGLTAMQTASAKAIVPMVGPRESSVATVTAQLARFHGTLAPVSAETLADALGRIHAAARDESVILEQGSYRLALDGTEPLARFEVLLPVKASYPQIRRLLAKVMRDVPSLALESLSFSRQAIGEGTIDAQLRFVLYLKKR